MGKKSIWLVAGLGYGDEGKGSVVDYLTRKENAHAVVRYNGGAQAGHRVVLPDGRAHVFSQFSSGTFVPQVATHLSRFMLVEPIGMMSENDHLKSLWCDDAFLRLTIDERAPIITPFHIATNRLLELKRGNARHGSCGLGIGETMEDLAKLGEEALVARDLADEKVLREKLILIRSRKLAKVIPSLEEVPVSEDLVENRAVLEDTEVVDRCIERYKCFVSQVRIVDGNYLGNLLQEGVIIFEGAQGMLLDPKYGVWPHVTKTDITFKNALTLLEEAGIHEDSATRVGVLRGYFTRHGAGPFATESKRLTALLQDECNKDNGWQGEFRVGHFDLVATRYALESIGGVDELAITNLDRLIDLPKLKVCTGYGEASVPVYESVSTLHNKEHMCSYADMLKGQLGCEDLIMSFGPTYIDKL